MAEKLGSSKEVNKDKKLSEAQAGIKSLSLSDPQPHLEEILRQSTSETSMHGKGKSRDSIVPESPSTMPFKEHQLKQLRAQCIVYRAFSNGVQPREQYLEIALGTPFSGEGN